MTLWSRFSARIYDSFMATTEEACLSQWREELLFNARGRVLEIGAGTGVNAAHYPDRVESIDMAEPNADMRRVLTGKLREDARVRVVDWSGEDLRAADGSYDTVVGTLVLCTVADPDAALGEIRRVLAPGGAFLFLEHVAAEPEGSRFRWQRRLEPMWKPVAGGCHLTRRTEAAIEAAGFELVDVKRESMRKAVSVIRPTIRGIAQVRQ